MPAALAAWWRTPCPDCGQRIRFTHFCKSPARPLEEPPVAYDPVPDLAALFEGVRDFARSGGDLAVIGRVLAGPYARLRGGLLLNEPGREHVSTEEALREALVLGPAE